MSPGRPQSATWTGVRQVARDVIEANLTYLQTAYRNESQPVRGGAGTVVLRVGHLAQVLAGHRLQHDRRALTLDLGHAESGHGRGSEMIHDHGP